MLKKNKGITLVALVITIIVLLILAVVAIGAVRDSGIIGHAQNSADKYNTGKSEEESKLKGFEDAISEYENGESFGTSGDGSGDIVEIEPEEPKVTYKDGVPIPDGFYYVTGTKDTGFVISDDKADENNANGKSGNQFVWVPVTEDISTTSYVSGTDRREPDVITGNGNEYDAVATNLQRAECTENPEDSDEVLTADDFKVQLTEEYKLMADSVNKYDGFYVGRYETSRNGVNPESKYGATTAYNSSTENDWYGLYALNKKYKTSSVQGSMIWGIQYDKMMTWMGNDATNFYTSNRNTDSQRRTGYVLTDVIRNVYDLAGNSFEWTLEAYDTLGRVQRGGCCNNDGSPSHRGAYVPTDTQSGHGSRLALYIV